MSQFDNYTPDMNEFSEEEPCSSLQDQLDSELRMHKRMQVEWANQNLEERRVLGYELNKLGQLCEVCYYQNTNKTIYEPVDEELI